MSRVAIDTSGRRCRRCPRGTNVVIAAVQASHPHHAPARGALEKLLSAGDTLVFPAHVLLEAYSVLTRLPGDLRIEPELARSLIRDFAAMGEVVVLDARSHIEVVERAAANGIRGGMIYDGVIAATAAKHADVLLTFNRRDMRRFGAAIEIRAPGIG